MVLLKDYIPGSTYFKTEVYSEPCQTSKMGFFAKITEGSKPLTISTKSFILDVWQGSKYNYVSKHIIFLQNGICHLFNSKKLSCVLSAFKNFQRKLSVKFSRSAKLWICSKKKICLIHYFVLNGFLFVCVRVIF